MPASQQLPQAEPECVVNINTQRQVQLSSRSAWVTPDVACGNCYGIEVHSQTKNRARQTSPCAVF